MDEVLEILGKATARMQKLFDEIKDSSSKHAEYYEKMIKAQEASEVQKLEASLMKRLDYDRLEMLSSQLSLFYVLQIFAFKVKILQISVTKINTQMSQAESGKTREIDEAKKDIDKLMILLEAQYELIRKIGEDRKTDLFYIS